MVAWEVEDYEWLPGAMITIRHDIEILVSMQDLEMRFGCEAKHRTEDHDCVICRKYESRQCSHLIRGNFLGTFHLCFDFENIKTKSEDL